MEITVTAKHIQRGVPGSKYSCPIALAMKEKKGVKGVSVGCSYLTYHNRNNRLQVYDLPSEAIAFVTEFDLNGTASPITFTPKKWKNYAYKTV